MSKVVNDAIGALDTSLEGSGTSNADGDFERHVVLLIGDGDDAESPYTNEQMCAVIEFYRTSD
jgi:hypothetical protein